MHTRTQAPFSTGLKPPSPEVKPARAGSPQRQWQTSEEEHNFLPMTLRQKTRELSNDPEHKSLNELPRLACSVAGHDDKIISWGKYQEDTVERLHRSPTRSVRTRNIDKGLVPRHLVDGTIPGAGKALRSEDYFKPNKFDRPQSVQAPVHFAHEYRVVHTADPNAYDRYRQGLPTKEVPLRIVSHEYKGFQLNKKSPDVSHRGVARNVMGGFYTN
mmetsp:Transcript_7130/g.10694  ORF Transcript_7130/g.10694 Transcript_7130/m.10694 type:complete len:215 (-) Transcript_7130:450-1094(-)|eukprot:CAMPEP_0113943992 /NCGR_PEP_ID=MMETSP1339-20121228/30373_1 /TAXON_ID=94617 /ORGANISM="Fibrocapsa japonica" /LENGTH=214 /DNA_ID=CAMNT_0000949021 /DNA_START=158 /DNA_END=802 /DNA_ORIENTATION=- /assembly_acc=CAM_ASM_000762